ncbi:hypothetical protein [Streptomyces endophyticus]|uniref:Uncharacterized protein n=1 Tax=Streptomyces endophyticus TaxID=714166 RepID=A0ABU6F2E5_9ACTN|nr:hypothetical protein [Streptomyces endophyticus]MEB8338014.1 hypothetical protein [Streptomyces endophyticus]
MNLAAMNMPAAPLPWWACGLVAVVLALLIVAIIKNARDVDHMQGPNR